MWETKQALKGGPRIDRWWWVMVEKSGPLVAAKGAGGSRDGLAFPQSPLGARRYGCGLERDEDRLRDHRLRQDVEHDADVVAAQSRFR